MNKQDIEERVREILQSEKHPLETAYEAEIAQYEHTLMELKLLHKRHLNECLDTFKKRGLKNSETARKIAERIATL